MLLNLVYSNVRKFLIIKANNTPGIINRIKNMLQSAIKSYLAKGYAVLPNFLTQQGCKDAISEIHRLIQDWNPTPEEICIFSTRHDNYKKQDYYLKSGDQVRFFLESGGYKDGKFLVDKQLAVSKIAHNLHELNQIFRGISYQKVIKDICNNVGIRNPIVLQSMAILKSPGVNEEVLVHQDSTYLYDEPRTMVGFWVPFEDTTLENGCLWAIPGSHKKPLYMRSFYDFETKQATLKVYKEKDYKDEDFEPILMKKGDLVFFHGLLIHKSEANRTQKHRYSYTWHIKERDSVYAASNWLQRDKFPEIQFK